MVTKDTEIVYGQPLLVRAYCSSVAAIRMQYVDEDLTLRRAAALGTDRDDLPPPRPESCRHAEPSVVLHISYPPCVRS